MVALEHLPAPKGNFTPGPKCYQTCLDWVKECELLLNVPLASKSKAAKATYVLIWAGKGGRTHIKSLNLTMEEKGDRSVLLKCSWSGESRNPMQLHQTSAAWSKVILALQSTLTKPLFCATSVNILQKPTIDSFGMQ